MSIRPPRPPRRPREQRPVRDWTSVGIISLVAIIVLLRIALAAFDVGTWTVAWKLVELPTEPVVDLLLRVALLTRTPIGHLTLAEIILGVVCGFGAMTALSSVALRRPD